MILCFFYSCEDMNLMQTQFCVRFGKEPAKLMEIKVLAPGSCERLILPGTGTGETSGRS